MHMRLQRWIGFAAIVMTATSNTVAAGPTLADPDKPVVAIGFHGRFARGTFPRNGPWLGLFCTGLECELREVNVQIGEGRAKNVVLDEDEALDVVRVVGEPIALFHGLALRAGKVKTWYLPPQGYAWSSRQYTALQKLGRWSMPWGSEPLTLSWVRLPDNEGKRYHLSGPGGQQFLFALPETSHYGGDTTPIVEWIGDLDGDGKMDILLSLPDDNCGYDERLYLSSQAGQGEIVHKAAQLSGREAACGC